MRRYRDQDDLRKLKPATTASFAGRRHSDVSDDEAGDAEIKHYAIIEAAAAIASSKATDRVYRLIGIIVAAIGLIGTGLVWLANTAINTRIEDEFANRSNQVYGFVRVQRGIDQMLRSYDRQLIDVAHDIGDLEAEEWEPEDLESRRRLLTERAIDSVTSEAMVYAEQFTKAEQGIPFAVGDLGGYLPTPIDLEVLEHELSIAYDAISRTARGLTYYGPIVDLGVTNPSVAAAGESFPIDFTYASGITLLNSPSFGRDVGANQQLYDVHEQIRGQIPNWPEYKLLFSLLLEAEFNATNDERLRTIASEIERLNPSDRDSMMWAIIEIAVDANVDAGFSLAASRTAATIRRGCVSEGFLSSDFCNELDGYGFSEMFQTEPVGSLLSVGNEPAVTDAPRWSVSLQNGSLLSKDVPQKETHIDGSRLR